MTGATPKRQPWTMLPDSDGQWLVMDETGRLIAARCESKLVAALIVAAVNRDAHVAPLMEALEGIDLSDSTLDDADPDEIIIVRRPASVWKRAHDVLHAAKEATS